MKRKAFTLIELLVVIAIIGILAAMILLSLASARKKARDSRRKSDLRQVKAALELYSSDNNEKYIVSAAGGTFSQAAQGPLAPLTLNGVYLKTLPTDPTNADDYQYFYKSDADGSNYVISVDLENTGDSGTGGLGALCQPVPGLIKNYDPGYCVNND